MQRGRCAFSQTHQRPKRAISRLVQLQPGAAGAIEELHVFDIDHPGHGKTVTSPDYPMNAQRIGTDLGDFIQQQIGKPVFISGNSSGGLLATWLAAYRPQLIRAVVLEDPPLFSSEYPRVRETIAARAFKTSYTAATVDHPDDFLLYWIHSNATFFRKNMGPGTPFILTQAIRPHRQKNPGKPVDLALVQNDTVRMMLRGLDQYDPRIGAAFYDGSWNRGFDHSRALQAITCPTLLMQANSSKLSNGTLDGAMSVDEAQPAVSLLKKGQYVKVDASHVVNLDRPDIFVQTLMNFFHGQ